MIYVDFPGAKHIATRKTCVLWGAMGRGTKHEHDLKQNSHMHKHTTQDTYSWNTSDLNTTSTAETINTVEQHGLHYPFNAEHLDHGFIKHAEHDGSLFRVQLLQPKPCPEPEEVQAAPELLS